MGLSSRAGYIRALWLLAGVPTVLPVSVEDNLQALARERLRAVVGARMIFTLVQVPCSPYGYCSKDPYKQRWS